MSRCELLPGPCVRRRLAWAFGPGWVAAVSAFEWFWICMSLRAPCLCAADRRCCFPIIPSHRRQFLLRCSDPLPVLNTGLFWKAMSLNALDRPPLAAQCGGEAPDGGPQLPSERRPDTAVRFDRPLRARQGFADAVDAEGLGPAPPAPARLRLTYERTMVRPSTGIPPAPGRGSRRCGRC